MAVEIDLAGCRPEIETYHAGKRILPALF